MNANPLRDLSVKIFADGADQDEMLRMASKPFISGFTTNPTLMRKAGVSDYLSFVRGVAEALPDRPISFEVFADDFEEMKRQARLLASYGNNVYVKIPITNTRGEPSDALLRRLSAAGIRLNVTALMTAGQVEDATACLEGAPSGFVSVFAGRIADTGRDPMPIMAHALAHLRANPGLELIWASPREVLNIFQADEIGCHIITATTPILEKLDLIGKDLLEFSRETVQMFHDDASAAGYELPVGEPRPVAHH